MNNIGKQIKEIREIKGMSRAELGEIVGLSPDKVQEYENGAKEIREETAFSFADALEVSTYALSRPDLLTPMGVMYALFEIEDNYGISPDNFKVLGAGEAGSIADMFSCYVSKYHEVEKKLLNECKKEKGQEENIRKIQEEYKMWKWNFAKFWPIEAARIKAGKIAEVKNNG